MKTYLLTTLLLVTASSPLLAQKDDGEPTPTPINPTGAPGSVNSPYFSNRTPAEVPQYARIARAYSTAIPIPNESKVAGVAFGGLEDYQLEELTKDLTTLQFILERNLGQNIGQEPVYKMGIPLLLRSRDGNSQISYVEGLGVIINLAVPFPLVRPDAAGTNQPPRRQTTEWEQAQRELYGGEPTTREPVQWNEATGMSSLAYDAQLVERLKLETIESLANANNLRHVGSEDWICVHVSGSSNPSGLRGQNESGSFLVAMITRTTHLTLRIRKSAADDLAAKRISLDDFKNQVQVHTYLEPANQPATKAPNRFLRSPF